MVVYDVAVDEGMVIVVVVKVTLVDVGEMVVVVRLGEGSGVMVVVVQVVIVENGAAPTMIASRPKQTAKRPRREVRSFMMGGLAQMLQLNSDERMCGWACARSRT